MSSKKFRVKLACFIALAAFLVAGAAYASHSWENYHWARQANPFNLRLGDNVSSAWDSHLATASADWSLSNVLDTTVVAGGTKPSRCRPTSGRVEICNAKYGNNGWLGLAQIWITGGEHITQGIVKLNDTYFNKPTYNTPAWRRLVMCQEVGHTFGLDHQDENFSNPNLGTCMDYTSDPDGPPSNEHPNAHDYEQLETIYNGHLDAVTTTIKQAAARLQNNGDADNAAEWGKSLRKDKQGKTSLYVRDLGKGEKVFTFILWAE